MPKGIPRPGSAAGVAKSQSRIEDKLDRLIEAQTQLVGAQREMVEAIRSLLVGVAQGSTAKALERITYDTAMFSSAPAMTPGGADQTMGKPGQVFVPRGTKLEATLPAGKSRTFASCECPAGPGNDCTLTAEECAARSEANVSAAAGPAAGFEAASDDDPVASLYNELASYSDEDESPPPPLDEAELWGKRLTAWRGSKLWMEDWGPRPGQADCQVPPYLMNGRG